MTWLILLIGIPAIIVPVVLLCGFAGCGLDVKGTAEPLGKPSNLHAKLSSNRKAVDLWWLPTGGQADSFETKRVAPDGSTDFVSLVVANTVKAIKAGHTPQISDPAQVTIPPSAPTLTAVAVSATTNRLTWTASPNATKYRLEHVPDLAMIAQGTATTADHNITAGTSHAYRVIAIVADGFDDSVKQDVASDPRQRWSQQSPTVSDAGVPANPSNGQNALAFIINIRRSHQRGTSDACGIPARRRS
jgi:hypothetical protein